MFNITNDISDTYNPNEDIFHLMCRQFPRKPICETLEDNGFYYTLIKANPIYLNFDDENEAKEFLEKYHFPQKIEEWELNKISEIKKDLNEKPGHDISDKKPFKLKERKSIEAER